MDYVGIELWFFQRSNSTYSRMAVAHSMVLYVIGFLGALSRSPLRPCPEGPTGDCKGLFGVHCGCFIFGHLLQRGFYLPHDGKTSFGSFPGSRDRGR